MINSKIPPRASNSLNNKTGQNGFQEGNLLQGSNSVQVNNGSGSVSKLHLYFSSSQYLSSQEEISVFIENFPIIDISQSHKSINDILPLLIKQNDLLSKKCQNQVLLIKQSFSKHQSITKQNRKVKEQMTQVQNYCTQLINKKQAELAQAIKRLENQNQRKKNYVEFIYKSNQVWELLLSGEYKKCEEITRKRQKRILWQDLESMMRDNSLSSENKQKKQTERETIISLQQIQSYCRQARKRSKYYARVKSSVEQFISRLIKITQIIPPEHLSKELEYQSGQFLSIITELISLANGESEVNKKREKRRNQKQRNDKSSQIREKLSPVNSQSSLISRLQIENSRRVWDSQGQKQRNSVKSSYFQSILQRYINQTSSKSSQTIRDLQCQVQQLRSTLHSSKQYYETYLINSKMQFEQQKRQIQEQLTIKDEMIRHFEGELQKIYGIKQELENRLKVIEQQNEAMKDRQKPLDKEIQQLKKQIQQNEESIKKAVQNNRLIQDQLQSQLLLKEQEYLSQLQSHQNNLKLQQKRYQQKSQQRSFLIQQKQQQITALKTYTKQLKQVIQDKNIQISRITKRLHVIEQDQVRKLQRQIEQIQRQIIQSKRVNQQLLKQKDQLSRSREQLNHEMLLHTTYIKQLQLKCTQKNESIQKLNKRLSTLEQANKVTKTLSENNQKLQTQIQSLTDRINKTLEENLTLKRLTKEMKRQLQEVYHTINDLKSIQQDRQRLIIESQKSQRWKEQIMRDYDQMKYQILKVQAQNKNLLLQNKHYKNALKRIEMIN